MSLIRRSGMTPKDRADLENAVAGNVTNAANADDIMAALVELGELFAAQDDALVELAELISE